MFKLKLKLSLAIIVQDRCKISFKSVHVPTIDLTRLQYKLYKIWKIYFFKNFVKVFYKSAAIELVHHLVLEGGDQPVHQQDDGEEHNIITNSLPLKRMPHNNKG